MHFVKIREGTYVNLDYALGLEVRHPDGRVEEVSFAGKDTHAIRHILAGLPPGRLRLAHGHALDFEGAEADFLRAQLGLPAAPGPATTTTSLEENPDGSWTARAPGRSFAPSFTGSRVACAAWLRAEGEPPAK